LELIRVLGERDLGRKLVILTQDPLMVYSKISMTTPNML
jgi:hypothetical protein